MSTKYLKLFLLGGDISVIFFDGGSGGGDISVTVPTNRRWWKGCFAGVWAQVLRLPISWTLSLGPMNGEVRSLKAAVLEVPLTGVLFKNLSWAQTSSHWSQGARCVNNAILDPLDQLNLQFGSLSEFLTHKILGIIKWLFLSCYAMYWGNMLCSNWNSYVCLNPLTSLCIMTLSSVFPSHPTFSVLWVVTCVLPHPSWSLSS